MHTMLSRGIDWLAKMQKQHLAVPVIYERLPRDGRKRGQRVEVLAVMGRSGVDGDTAVDSVRVDAEAMDFLIDASILKFGKTEIEPRTDDRIHVKGGSQILVYEVVSNVLGSPPWRWSDSHRTIRRISTKLASAKGKRK